MRVLFALSALVAMHPAFAADEGIPVTVRVTDDVGSPISTAVVRPIADETRHRVNTANGEWTEAVLYLSDGTEMLFTKGTVLELEVSAPGYLNEKVKYEVRKRRNLIPVQLAAQPELVDEVEPPIIGFGRTHVLDK